MKSSIKNKFIKLGFLEDNSFTVYGQEIIDKFLSIIITKLKSEGFKHYNLDFINNKKEGIISSSEIGLPIKENNLILPCGIYGRIDYE